MTARDRPRWQLPPGVCRSTWDYMHAPHIAEDYDDYFAYNRLFDLDQEVLSRYLRRPGLVVDLGCGTGRALVPLARRGLQGLGVDLSENMLRLVQEKSRHENLPIDCVRANVVELDWLADGSADYVICLFSTLGMVHGAENRQQMLRHVRRVLKRDGVFVFHVHNFWFNLFTTGARLWVVENLLRSCVVRDIRRGDKYFPYRGIPQMFLHIFTYSEVRRLLRQSGLKVRETISLDATRARRLTWPWLLGRVRANGWIVVAQKR